jgi:DNA polymerase elongation subunit (family B)
MRILAWDIEASSLTANFGIILCVGFKEVGGKKSEVFSSSDYDEPDLIKAEKLLLKDVSERLLDCDIWLTHFGTYFDILFVNTRLLFHRLPVIPPNFNHIDTWKISKNRLKLSNNRLVTIQNFLGLDNEKNAIKPMMWIRALGGHKPSMRYITDHCRRDVEVLAETYERIKPLVLDHPTRGLIDGRGGCGICDSRRLQKRGFHLTRTRRYQRYQCMKCGHWSKGTKPVEVFHHV